MWILVIPLFLSGLKSWYFKVIFYRRMHYYLESRRRVFSLLFNLLAIFSDISFTHLLWNFSLWAEVDCVCVFDFFSCFAHSYSFPTLLKGPPGQNRSYAVTSSSFTGDTADPNPESEVAALAFSCLPRKHRVPATVPALIAAFRSSLPVTGGGANPSFCPGPWTWSSSLPEERYLARAQHTGALALQLFCVAL